MNYIMTQEQLDKFIKLYFDKWFINSKYGTREFDNDGRNWTGFWIDDETLLVGHPELDDSEMWFSNGRILDGWVYFDIKPEEFYDSLKRYLERKYDIDIQKVV